MQSTIIAVYDSFEHAQQAMDDLLGQGFARQDVQLNPYADQTGVMRASGVDEQSKESAHSRASDVRGFLRGLLRLDEHRGHADMYAEAVRRGASILTVTTEGDMQRDRAVSVLQKHHPVDMDQRLADWRRNRSQGHDEHVPLSSRPGVTEIAYAERVPAGADASAAVAQAGGDHGPVRVYPAGAVDAAQSGTTGAVSGSDFADTRSTADDADFREHWSNTYGRSGAPYEDYDAAYRYGCSMATSYRYRSYRWDDAEAEMRREWEAHNPGRTWERVREAVRFGAEKVMGRDTPR